VVRSSAGPSSGLGASIDQVWPCPGDPWKVRFILRDEEEVQLWDVLGGRGLAMESDLAQTRERLKEALEWLKFVHQAIMVDLPHIAEVSFPHLSLTPWFLTSCFSVFASCFAGLGGDVEPQVLFPLGGARLDGARGHGVMVGQ